MIRAAIVVIAAMASIARADAPSGYRCGDGKPDVGTGCTCPAGKRSVRDAHDVAICVAAPPTFGKGVTQECKKDASKCVRAGLDLYGTEEEKKANFEAGCNRDDADSCWMLTTYVTPAAFGELRDRACLLGSEDACRDLGKTLASDDKKLRAARARFDAACARNRCAGVGMLYELGIGVAKDVVKAAEYYARACKQRLTACDVAARIYNEVGGHDDKLYALEARMCEAGQEAECWWVAQLTRQGRGVARDPVKAFAMFEKMCRPDGTGACVELGEMLVAGEGTVADPARAFALFKKKCEGDMSGFSNGACEHLADLYDRGIGVAKDQNKATSYLFGVCLHRENKGCTEMARRYRDSNPARASYFAHFICSDRKYAPACDLEKELEAKP